MLILNLFSGETKTNFCRMSSLYHYLKFQELEDQSMKKLPKGLGKAREDLTGAKFENMESQPAVK